MRQYSIDRVEASWATLDLKEGVAQGTSIQEARNAPSWTQKPTGNGRVVRVYNPDRSGTLTIQVDQESKLMKQLQDIHEADKLLRNQVFPFIVKDESSGEQFNYTNCYIMTEPDMSRGTESAVFPWVFHYERRIKIHPNGDQNVVGN